MTGGARKPQATLRAASRFLDRIPEGVRGRLALEVPACQAAGCVAGWLDTPQGSQRCPVCLKAAASARLGRAGVQGGRYDRAWETIRLRHKSWQRVRELSRDVLGLVSQGQGVALLGLPGRGTTQAAALLVRDAVEGGHSGLLVSWPAWVEEVQSDYTRHVRTQAEHVADLVTPALVALDAVGEAASVTGALERKLFERVLGARFAAGRATVITSGLTRRELEEAMGERAFDRFRHGAEWVLFTGPNEREEEARLRAATLPALQLPDGRATPGLRGAEEAS